MSGVDARGGHLVDRFLREIESLKVRIEAFRASNPIFLGTYEEHRRWADALQACRELLEVHLDEAKRDGFERPPLDVCDHTHSYGKQAPILTPDGRWELQDGRWVPRDPYEYPR